MPPKVVLEDLIEDIGGCGRYQLLSAITVHGCKIVVTWSALMMAVTGAVPDWGCVDIQEDGNTTNGGNATYSSHLSCLGENGTQCRRFYFDDSMNTIVNEWNLVCGRRWITATVTTIQMAGLLVGCLISGQLADTIGRRPSYYLGQLVLVIGNLIAYFSVSWEMFAAVRFVIGLGCGAVLTTQYSFICESMTAKWRTVTVVVPSWPIETSLFALVAWLVHDWRYLHLAVTIIGVPCLLTYIYMKESFRWLFAKNRKDEAEAVVRAVAEINRRPVPDLTPFMVIRDEKASTRVTVADLFRTKELALVSIRSIFVWVSCGYIFYAITLGVQALSGNMFFNFFLLGSVDIPCQLISIILVNRYGRRATSVGLLLLSGSAAVVVACSQYMDPSIQGRVTNGFALLSKVAAGPAWQAFSVLTLEVYPTVIRNLGYGASSVGSRVGAMIAPQIVYLDTYVPGLLYFLCGALMITSSVLTCTLPETKDMVLADTVTKSHEKKEKVIDTRIV